MVFMKRDPGVNKIFLVISIFLFVVLIMIIVADFPRLNLSPDENMVTVQGISEVFHYHNTDGTSENVYFLITPEGARYRLNLFEESNLIS